MQFPRASDLFDAAAPSNPAASLYRAAVQLLPGARAASDIGEGLRLLKQASLCGHAGADELLAVMSGMGVGTFQSWKEAFEHLQRAAERGSWHARRQLHVLDRDDVSAAADFAEHQGSLRLCRSIQVDSWLAPSERTLLSSIPHPGAVSLTNFLPLAVCEWIIELARGRLRRARVQDATTAAVLADEGRNNTAFELGLLDLDLVILLVRARIAAAVGVPVSVLEAPWVLHYEAGERYLPHHDYFHRRQPGHAGSIKSGGQRLVTFLIYLNAGYEGGETDFPLMGLPHRGGPGDALYLGNIDPDGAPDPRTLHAGLAPTKGEKWLLSQWIRDRPPS